VPAVVAMSEADASAAIQDVHLHIAVARKYNAAKAGTVYAQDPKSGTTVAVDSTVTISVSLGIQQVTVPDVAGKSESDARAALKAAGLVAGTTHSYSTVVSSGIVISSDPSAGSSVDIHSTVTLNISKGPQMVTVPDLHGLDEATAQSKLDALGLKTTADTSQQAPTTADVGKVFNQVPSSGTKVLLGSPVTVFIGQAPPLAP
jgi:beta-lactam-binding protein with PASTA domain